MTAELHKDMSITDYHARTDALSKTMIAKADCLARYKYHYIDGGEQKKTKSLRLGNAMHVMALEPELWKSSYHIMPETYHNTKGEEMPWKNDARMSVVQDQMAYAGYDLEIVKGKPTFIERPTSKTILTRKEFENVEGMANALVKNPLALSLLRAEGYVEASIFWEEDGQKFRCRPDFMQNSGLLVDLKTAQSVNPEIFMADAFKFKYALSAALTWRGYKALYDKEPDNYVFLCIEPEPPYLISCFEALQPISDVISMTYLEYGEKLLTKYVAKIQEAKSTNSWPAYQEKITGMRLPRWAEKQLIETGEVI